MNRHAEKPHFTDSQASASAAVLASELGSIEWSPCRRCGISEKPRTRVFRGVWYARAQRGTLGVYLAAGGGYFGRRRGGVDGHVVATPQEAAETAPPTLRRRARAETTGPDIPGAI